MRRTPFTRRVEANGVQAYTIYNHMLLPAFFESTEADYHHLLEHVQVWDVSAERQVEISGPDSARLIQMMTPRDLSKMADDQCYYIPIVDSAGGVLNDPVCIRLPNDRWWVSLADSDVELYAKGLALGAGLDVTIFEPDVSPLAVQGPKADALMERVFGPIVHDIRFFRHKRLPFMDTEFVVARSGWSKQGGYEIYVDGGEYGEAVWDTLFDAGQDLNVRAGCPNLIERIEGGLLSFGSDMTREHNPYECGLDKYCAESAFDVCVGGPALREVSKTGPRRRIRGLILEGDSVPACRDFWPVNALDGSPIGRVSSAVWSPRLGSGIAVAMIDQSHWEAGTLVQVDTSEGLREAHVQTLPFV